LDENAADGLPEQPANSVGGEWLNEALGWITVRLARLLGLLPLPPFPGCCNLLARASGSRSRRFRPTTLLITALYRLTQPRRPATELPVSSAPPVKLDVIPGSWRSAP
jgi:hypothetical protein